MFRTIVDEPSNKEAGHYEHGAWCMPLITCSGERDI